MLSQPEVPQAMHDLLGPHEIEKIFCPSHREDNKGHTVVNCTRGLGHFGQHVDCHAGRKWDDR